MDKTIQIDTFSRFSQVSRETIRSLKKYENILIESNKTLNLIGWQTEDIYQNLVITYIYKIQYNQEINKKLFKLPEMN